MVIFGIPGLHSVMALLPSYGCAGVVFIYFVLFLVAVAWCNSAERCQEGS